MIRHSQYYCFETFETFQNLHEAEVGIAEFDYKLITIWSRSRSIKNTISSYDK